MEEEYEITEEEFLNIDEDAGRITKGGPLDKYLQKIQLECDVRNPYNNGTYWINPMMPNFALSKRPSPEALYLPKVFIWLPHALLNTRDDKLKCVTPGCTNPLNKKSFLDDPKARKIVDVHE